jgi:hypothetical protein
VDQGVVPQDVAAHLISEAGEADIGATIQTSRAEWAQFVNALSAAVAALLKLQTEGGPRLEFGDLQLIKPGNLQARLPSKVANRCIALSP